MEAERGRKDETPAIPPGETGEISRADLDDLRQAAAAGWNVPSGTRRKLVDRLTSIVCNPNTSTRTLLSVGRVLQAFDKVDIEANAPLPSPIAVQVNVGAPIPQLTPEERAALIEADKALDRLGIGAGDMESATRNQTTS